VDESRGIGGDMVILRGIGYEGKNYPNTIFFQTKTKLLKISVKDKYRNYSPSNQFVEVCMDLDSRLA
jgi:hypothetical protein